MRTLYMETTRIPVGQTVSEIQRVLGEYGACSVMSEYEKGDVKAVCFEILFMDRRIPFRLPCRWDPIYEQIKEARGRGKKIKYRVDEEEDQAKRIAWRQILRWIEAQMALVETRMVKVEEVFLPYVQVGIKGETLFQQIEGKGFKQLTNGGSL